MNIQFSKINAEQRTTIEMDEYEVMDAIDKWLIDRGVNITGPRTITIDGVTRLQNTGCNIYVDSTGSVVVKISNGYKEYEA